MNVAPVTRQVDRGSYTRRVRERMAMGHAKLVPLALLRLYSAVVSRVSTVYQ